jgi:hypothetical protein
VPVQPVSTIAFLPMYMVRGTRGAADKRRHLSEFFGGTVALNGIDSQSRYGALMRSAAPFTRNGRFFGRAIHTRFASLPDDVANAFGLRDVASLRKSDYEVIRTNLAEAEAVHSLPKLEEMSVAAPSS